MGVVVVSGPFLRFLFIFLRVCRICTGSKEVCFEEGVEVRLSRAEAYGDLDNRAEQATFRGVTVNECLIVGVLVGAIVVTGGVTLVLRFKEDFEAGVCNIRRESCVQKFPRAILATLIAISTFATQTWRAIVVPLPSLLKSTSMKCLCLSSRVFFFTFISSLILSINSCCSQEERPSITW
jgi:hypothetical protein